MPKKAAKGKKAKKSNEEAAIKTGIRNSNLWEAQLSLMDLSRKHYRDIVGSLAHENEGMRDQMHLTEKDTIDVVTFLKKKAVDKDEELDRLQEEVKAVKQEHREAKDELIANFAREKRQLDEQISRRADELDSMRQELSQMKEFQKKKAQMQRELEEIKAGTIRNEREHRETLQNVERRIFLERMQLQQEAKDKVQEIGTRAQMEAIKSLNETSRHIYQENIDLKDALRVHQQQMNELKKFDEQLARYLINGSNDKELNERLIQEKLEQIHKQTNSIDEYKDKILLVENSLTQFIDEFALECKQLQDQSRADHEASRREIERLQRTLDDKTKEMSQVRKLAQILVEQRTELDAFFLDALQYVKKQIHLNRLHYRRDAFNAYQNRMLTAHHGQGDYPRVRTFHQTVPGCSTNSVFQDLEQASKWTHLDPEVDIGDLTWEQKEQVLRALFLRMNTKQPRNSSGIPKLPQITANTCTDRNA